MNTTSVSPVKELTEKEKIKQRNQRDFEHALLGATFALTITSFSLSNANTALPYIALAAAILWTIVFLIDIAKKNWISAFLTMFPVASLFNLSLVILLR